LNDLVNTKSQAFKKLQPDLNSMSEEQIFDLIHSEPRILRRPILVGNKQLVFGFNNEAYKQILN